MGNKQGCLPKDPPVTPTPNGKVEEQSSKKEQIKNEASDKNSNATSTEPTDSSKKEKKQKQLGQLSEAMIIPNTDAIDNGKKEEKKEETIKITIIEMEDKESYYFLNPNNLNPEYDRDVVSIVALSDTLSAHSMEMLNDIPNFDILIHCGNFTHDGTLKQIQDFNEWLNLLLTTKKCKYALIIAGNHEITFDRQYYTGLQNMKDIIATDEGMPDNPQNSNMDIGSEVGNEEGMNHTSSVTVDNANANDDELDMVKKCRYSIKNAIYLEDQAIEILGLKFYGTPWSLIHTENENGNYEAFSVATEDELKVMFDKIPYDCDIMISHYPPYLHNDGKANMGSKSLIEKLFMDVQPNLHIFGHITECHGVTKQANMDTAFMNCNCSNEENAIPKKPILVYVQPKLESFF